MDCLNAAKEYASEEVRVDEAKKVWKPSDDEKDIDAVLKENIEAKDDSDEGSTT